MARQQRKVQEGVAEMARELGDKAWCNGEGYTLADIAAGCTLGHLRFREAETGYAHDFTNLKKLAERLGRRAAFAETAPTP
jgi:glutathione S-transferase